MLRQLSLEKIRFRHTIRVEIALVVYFSYTTVCVNTCLAIATRQGPWQRRPPSLKSRLSLVLELFHMSKYSVILFCHWIELGRCGG